MHSTTFTYSFNQYTNKNTMDYILRQERITEDDTSNQRR